MSVRSGRVLPATLAGGLLASGMILGAGTASAATTCSFFPHLPGSTTYTVNDTKKWDVVDGRCINTKFLISPGLDGLSAVPVTTTTKKPPPTTTGTVPASNGAPRPGPRPTAPPRPVVLPPPPPAPRLVPVAPIRPAAPAGLLPGSFGAAPTGGNFNPNDLLKPGAFGAPPIGPANFGGYDPGLLLAPPPGAPLQNLQADNPVTTVSSVQAMGVDNKQGRLGLGATLGVLILAGLGGFAVRHMIMKRMRRAKPAHSAD